MFCLVIWGFIGFVGGGSCFYFLAEDVRFREVIEFWVTIFFAVVLVVFVFGVRVTRAVYG